MWAAISPSQWREWQELHSLEPIGSRQVGVMFAQLMSLIAALKGMTLAPAELLEQLGYASAATVELPADDADACEISARMGRAAFGV